MTSFLTGTTIAALLAVGMYFTLDLSTITMVEAYDDQSVLAHEISNRGDALHKEASDAVE
ncbi:hypothetical protein BV394_12345 [Brevirhabdus pacifica]|uniref:Uncharacterized protein n=1 Tax=Brevirhabdus pacifica TaxID=1267768 RepID=A0A1U7DKA6_9RHOB|nr:hypothetical protein [Brevirhabdus pacifica]APX90420.1 hypothetical protein BV394_12345 [Brevirhabdus pacifica]OWU78557.1 hypothetical protein ATO5_07120 [Loktanella sp. 22II-4b]PJJ85485.1 hypothetical protein CLV77_2355 [Brevirhabdus pacifica]